jgi:hypothetical protein
MPRSTVEEAEVTGEKGVRLKAFEMKRLLLLLALLLFLLLANLLPPAAEAQPVSPHVFFGTVTVGGAPAPGGVIIEARIGGINYAFTSAGDHIPRTASDGTYGLGASTFVVLADDPGTPQKEGGRMVN